MAAPPGISAGTSRPTASTSCCAASTRAKSRVRTDEPRVLRVRASDTDGAVWTVRLTQEPPAAEYGDAGDADCEVSGPAARLYLALWNRLPFPRVTGDVSVAGLWREKSAVG